ncbi:MAG: hypothetical protein H0V97_11595 [Actinobacteria bacterium]|nr:hypothetical protein [Actinomycetota bacterium]
MKKTLVISLMSALVMGLLPLSGATGAPPGRVTLSSSTAPAMMPGQTGWMALTWLAGPDALTEFSVTVTAPAGYQVTYPEGRTDTSLWDNDSLAPNEMDYTAFKIAVPENAPTTPVALTATVSYSYQQNKNQVRVKDQIYSLSMPIVAPGATAFDQVTTSLGELPADARSWVEMSYRGNAPSYDFKMSAPTPGPATVAYPADGAYTMLFRDPVLDVGETDHVAFVVDTTGMAPGTYSLGTSVAHRVAMAPRTAAGTVTFDVAGTQTLLSAQRAVPGGRHKRTGSKGLARFSVLEAYRLCAFEDSSYSSLEQLVADQGERVAAAGRTMSAYNVWRAKLSKSPLRRQRVFQHYTAICG